MNKKFTKLIAALALLVFMTPSLAGWGQTRTEETITYTFSSKDWKAKDNNNNDADWTCGNEGNGYTSGQGIQVTTGTTGANGTSPATFTNISKIVITYNTNKSAGAGSIGVKIGTNTETSNDVAYPGSGDGREGNYTTTFNYGTAQNGEVKITVNTTTNSIWLKSVEITYSSGGGNTPTTYTVTYDCAGGTSGCPTENPSGLSSNDIIELAAAPTKTHYTFGGWNDGTTTYAAGADYTVTSNVTMTAQWTVNTNTITVTGATHGTVSGFTNPVAYNTVVTLTYTHNDGEYYSATFASTDVSFSGTDNNKFIMPDRNVTITVTESALPVYTVTLSDGGTLTEEHYGAGVTLPNRTGDGTYTFAGWTTSNIATETTDAPTIIPTNVTYHPTENITLYPVYTRSEGDGEKWRKITGNFSTIDAGIYALIAPNGRAFNGTITSGHGQVTPSAFSFDDNNESTTAPTGTLELTLTPVIENEAIVGYTMYNSTNKYLYAKAASSGNLEWHSEESSYWKNYNNYNWVYNTNTAYLRTYTSNQDETTFRTYGNAANTGFSFVKKVSTSVTYYISTLSSIAVPSFDPESQNFSTASLTVTITANEGCAISYTTDGTDPESSSSATMTETNSATITVTTTTTIRALAFDGNDFSAEASQTYTRVYEVTLNSNGVAADPVEVVTGESTTLATPSNVPFGYSFRGWTATPATPTTLVSNTYTPNSNVTLYAVFGKNVYGNFEKVTLSQDDYSGYYLIVYNNTYALDSHYGNANTNTYGTYTDISDYYSLVNNTTHTIAYNETTAGLIVVAAKTTNGYSLYDTDGYLGDESSSTGAYLRWDSPFKAKQDEWTLGVNSIVNVKNTSNAIRWNNNSGSYRFAIYGTTGQQAIMLYKLKVNSLEGHYLQAYPTNTTATANITIEGPTVIESGAVLNMGEFTLTCNNPANLVIKDGAQLKVYTTGARDGEVQATVEKYIEHYTAANNGWNFIASPLTSAFAPDATMTSNTYDLYQLNNTKWENYKDNEGHTNANPGFSLVNGHGYLYANSGDVTLSFPGTVKPFNSVDPTANRVAVSAGWNLIGNPYTFNLFVNQPYYSISQAQAGITAQTTASNTDDIAPCTAVLVKANEAGDVTFYETLSSTSNNGNLNLVVAQAASNRGNATTIDNAIVSFNEGDELEKFYFGSQNANIYIPQGVEEYAIATSNAQGEMPVNFRANENGEYTLTVNAESVEMNYLHLIDNMTGADIDLLSSPSYTFNAKTTDYESRFRLVFASATMNEDSDNETFAFFSNDQLVIINEGQATLQVIDVNGRILRNETINGSTNVSMSNTPGVYMLRLINGSDVKVQKIVVK